MKSDALVELERLEMEAANEFCRAHEHTEQAKLAVNVATIAEEEAWASMNEARDAVNDLRRLESRQQRAS